MPYYTDIIGGGIGSEPEGYRRNDDSFFGPFDLGFTLTYFGEDYTEFFINNNGNISFGQGVFSFTPEPIDVTTDAPIIGPYWGDVDTRPESGGTVTLRTDIPNQIIVTWDQVGYYSSRTDLLASFQLVLRGPGFNVPAGEGDIGFFYNEIEWETGEASGGTNGFGGVEATAGFGDGLPESNPGEISIAGSQQPGISRILSNQFFWFNLGAGGIPTDPTEEPPEEMPPPEMPPEDPIALTDSAVSLTNTSVLIDVLANDRDPNNDPILLIEFSDAGNGTVSLEDNGTPDNLSDDRLVYSPNPNFSGFDSFTYSISDGNGGSDRGTVNIMVIETGTPTPGNNLPNAVNDSRTTAVNTPITINVLANDNDPDGDIIQLINFTNPSNGTVRRNNNNTPQDLSDDRLTYTPNPQFTGADSFTYRIADGNGGIDQATVEVTVGNNGNRNPIVGTPQEDNLIGVEVPETIAGLAGNDFLKGNEGNDLLLGGEGRDSLIGDSGNDILLGGEGDDILLGEEGVDILRGDGGRDRLLGGAEGDLFLLSAETAASSIEGADRIEDFQVGSDRLGLTGQITQENLDLSVVEGNTAIALVGTDLVLAIVERTTPDQLSDSFVFV